MRELLSSSHIVDYIDNSSAARLEHQRGSRSSSSLSQVTWKSLLQAVVGYVCREADAIVKMEEKPSKSISASSSRETKKKVNFTLQIKRMVALHVSSLASDHAHTNACT